MANDGPLTGYLLSRIERRTGSLEAKVDDLAKTCARIEARLDDMASKSHVAWAFGVTLLLVVLSLVGHMLVRSLAAG